MSPTTNIRQKLNCQDADRTELLRLLAARRAVCHALTLAHVHYEEAPSVLLEQRISDLMEIMQSLSPTGAFSNTVSQKRRERLLNERDAFLNLSDAG